MNWGISEIRSLPDVTKTTKKEVELIDGQEGIGYLDVGLHKKKG